MMMTVFVMTSLLVRDCSTFKLRLKYGNDLTIGLTGYIGPLILTLVPSSVILIVH